MHTVNIGCRSIVTITYPCIELTIWFVELKRMVSEKVPSRLSLFGERNKVRWWFQDSNVGVPTSSP